MYSIHETCRKLHQEVLNCMINNILDQNADSIAGLFSLFDLSSDVSKESRIEKLSKLCDTYGTPVIHTVSKRISCNKWWFWNKIQIN